MLVDQSWLYFNNYLPFYSKKRFLSMFITNKCNFKCSDCISQIDNPKEDNFSIDRYEHILSQLEGQYLVDLYGGEPLLFPERCIQLQNICRKYNHQIEIITNGFWYNNQKIKDIVTNEIKPNLIQFSIDNFHLPFNSIENICKLLEFYKDSKIAIYTGQVVNDKNKQLKIIYNNFDYSQYTILYYLKCGGKGKYIEGSCFQPECEIRGLTIDLNGDIYGACNFEREGCFVGNQEKISMEEIIQNINKISGDCIYKDEMLKKDKIKLIKFGTAELEKSKIYKKIKRSF